jgi:(R)-amidase
MSPFVAACQTAVEDLDIGANMATLRDRLDSLSARVDLAVFPEYSLTGFLPDRRMYDHAISPDGPVGTEVQQLAADHNLALVVGGVHCTGEDLYNATFYVGPDGDVSVYHKRHLWRDENAVLTPGDDLVTVETPAGTAGLLTGYDLFFVEDSAAYSTPEIDLLIVSAAWPDIHSDAWPLLVRARAIDGIRWVVAADRTGKHTHPDTPPVLFTGRSMVASPNGDVYKRLDRSARTLVTDLDPEMLEDYRDATDIYHTPEHTDNESPRSEL